MDYPVHERRHLGGHPSIEAVVVTFGILFLWFFLSLLIRPFFSPAAGFYVVGVIRFALLLVFMAAIDGRGDRWALRNMGFKRPLIKPILIGLAVTVPMLIGILSYIVFSLRTVRLEPGWPLLIPFLIVGPGFFEEGLFRGYVFNHFYTYSKLGWFKSSLYSGLMFAFSHLLNLLSGLSTVDILISITFALPISFLFGFMFLRMGKNIWGCLAAHVAIDTLTSIFVIRGGLVGLQFAVLMLSLAAVVITGFLLVNHQYPLADEIEKETTIAA